MVFVSIAFAVLGAILTALATSAAARRMLASIISTVVFWAVFTVQHLAPEIAEELVVMLLRGFETLRPTLLRAAAAMVKELTGQGVPEFTALERRVGGLPGAAAVPAFEGIARGVALAIAPERELTTESGMDNLAAVFALNLGLHVQGWTVGALADLVDLGQLKSLPGFHEAVEDGLGFSRLGRLIWRAPIEEAVTNPVKRRYAELYRFAIPDATQAIKGWYAGVYTDDALIALLTSAGFSHTRATELRDIEQRHLSPAEGLEAVEAGLITEDALDPLLRADGLGETRAGILKALLLGRRTQKELALIATTARRLFKAGDLEEDLYRQYLGLAHWRDDEITVALTADRLALREEKSLTVAELGDLVEGGTITAADYRARLHKQRYDNVDIDLLLAHKVRRLSPAQVVDAFIRGEVGEVEATGRLEGFGYSATDAALLLSLHGKRLSEGQVLDALRQNLIQPAQARTDLIQLGFSADQVDLLLAFVRRTLSPADVQAALLRGLLTEPQATAALVGAGYSPDEAAVIIALRRRLLSKGEILDAYGNALISRATALADLQARGLSAADAAAIVVPFDRDAAEATAKAAQKSVTAQAEALARAQAASARTGGQQPPPSGP